MRARAHARAHDFQQTPVTGGDTGDNAPAWDALDPWMTRFRASGSRDEKVDTVLAWGRAAGGTVDGDGMLHLPSDLRSCFASAELTRLAGDLRLMRTRF
jgi:hypothetical protein